MEQNFKIVIDNDEGGTNEIYVTAETCEQIDQWSVRINGAIVRINFDIVSVEIDEEIEEEIGIAHEEPITEEEKVNRKGIHDVLFLWGRTR